MGTERGVGGERVAMTGREQKADKGAKKLEAAGGGGGGDTRGKLGGGWG